MGSLDVIILHRDFDIALVYSIPSLSSLLESTHYPALCLS